MTKIEILKEIYAALNRDDISSFLKFFDPQILRVEFEGLPSGGIYRGLQELKLNFSSGRSTWAEGSCEPQEFISIDDKLIAFINVKVRLKDKQDWIVGEVTDVFTFNHDKVIEMRSFAKKQDALDWIKAQKSI